MFDSEEYRELRNGRRDCFIRERRMCENISIAENVVEDSLENVEGEISEIQTLTQEAVNEQMKWFIALLTHLLRKLTRWVQVMTTTRHPNHYLKTEIRTTSGTITQQSDMVTGDTRAQSRRKPMTSPDTDDKRTYTEYDKRFRRPMTPELTNPYEDLPDGITTLPSWIQTNNPRLLQTQLPTFRVAKNTFKEHEHVLQDRLRPMSNTLTEEPKLQYFQNPLREKTIKFYQPLPTTTETSLNDVLTNFRKELTTDDLKEVARYLWG